MPFGDGTGPLGQGPFTGRRGGGLGRGRGAGRGMGRGLGRGIGRGANGSGRVYPVNANRTASAAPAPLTEEQSDIADKIYQYLPKINCGACGYPTCMDCARAIARGKAPYNACRILKPEQHEKIKKIIEGR